MQLLVLIAATHVLQGVVASSSSFLHVLENRKSRVQQSVVAGNLSMRTRNGINATSAPRRVFIDLGANWANTLRLFEDIGTKRSETPWEVYAFEASPFIQPYIENFVAWLNGQGAKPPVTVPPSGSTSHLDMFATRYGCPTCESQGCEAMRSCMVQTFQIPLSELDADPSLQNTDLIQSRLDTPLHADPSLQNPFLIQSRLDTVKTASIGQNRFVAIPAAAGASSGTLDLGYMTAEQMIRGGAAVGTTMTVPMIDFPNWLTQSFTAEDYIVVKMDIEGAEFGILNTLLTGPNACFMDVLALECHPSAGDCAVLTQMLQQHPCISVMRDYAWDHYSSPDVYYAQDPRLEN